MDVKKGAHMDEPVQFPGPNTPPPQFLTFHGTIEAQIALAEAMAKARLEFGHVELSRKGQYGKREFEYAPLGSLTEATAKPLAKHGVTVLNVFTTCPLDRSKQRLTTWVMGHGARIEACLDFKPKEVVEGTGEFQGEYMKEVGKIQTYLVRYQYKALFTLDSEPDADDAPVQPERRQEPRREPPRADYRREPQRPMEPKAAPVAQVSKPQEAPPATNVTPQSPVTVANNSNTSPADDGPASEETGRAIKDLYRELGFNPLNYGAMVLKVAKVAPSELKASRKAAQVVLEHMQTMKLNGDKPASPVQGAA